LAGVAVRAALERCVHVARVVMPPTHGSRLPPPGGPGGPSVARLSRASAPPPGARSRTAFPFAYRTAAPAPGSPASRYTDP